MKSKVSAKSKKQPVTLRDLKTRKDPKGGTTYPGGTLQIGRGVVPITAVISQSSARGAG